MTPKPTEAIPHGMSNGKKFLLGAFVGLLILLGAGLGIALRIVMPHHGDGSGQGGASNGNIMTAIQDLTQVVSNPRDGFPAQNRVVILCMGIDDNWTNSDVVYSKDARTDTLFLLTLDLDNKKATMLSIPRDTYTHIAGTHWNFKINAAYQTGGPQRAIATVDELLGVHADHYMVLNIDATKRLVDAVGGVDVNVEHEMHYHDKWGHLSIDLMPGEQHLMGDQAVGFARYRHGDAGSKITPEDGDDRRMYRQHLLMHALIDKAKTFQNITQATQLIDTAMSTIRTDLTRTQLFDIAALYHGIQTDDLKTASLSGDDFRGPKGEWFYRLDMRQARAYVDWLVRGNEDGARPLINIVVKNGTKMNGLAKRAVDQLQAAGFTQARLGGNAIPKVKLTALDAGNSDQAPLHTDLVDTGVPDPTAMTVIPGLLGVADATQMKHPIKPNHAGWTPPTEISITLGQDYADLVKASEPADATVQPESSTTTQ